MFPEDPHEFQDRSLSPGPEDAEDEEEQPPSGSKANERDKERGRSIRFSGRLGLSEGRVGSPTQAVEESDDRGLDHLVQNLLESPMSPMTRHSCLYSKS